MSVHKFIALLIVPFFLASCHEEATMCVSDINVKEILDKSDYNTSWDSPGFDAPDKGCLPIKFRWTGNLRHEFCDSNNIQLIAAKELGFSPITSDSSIINISRPITKVVSCEDFYIEPLKHSFAYLVPEAKSLLHEIGRRFADTLSVRGGGQYRIKVTSLLRTPATVNKLKRVNRNASNESTHAYGTTFDISYSKFICDNPNGTRRTFEDLKNLLAEILHDLRNEGRCYVKYEVKQSCFHITTRKQHVENVEPSTNLASDA